MDLFTAEDYKKLFNKPGPNNNNALGMKDVKDNGGATPDQQGPMNEREPENYYLAEDEGKKQGRGSDGPVSDMPGSTVGLTPKNPRPGINEEQQENFNKIDFQKQDFGDSVQQINRDHDNAVFNEFSFKGFEEPGAAMTSDYRSGFGQTPSEMAPDGKDAPQYASRKNPVWGDVITDRYHGSGSKNTPGISSTDADLFSKNQSSQGLEAEAKGKPNGDVVMKDINPKVVQPLTSGSFDASRGARGARAGQDRSGLEAEAATLANPAPSPFGENAERNGQTTPGNGNDRRCPTSYFQFKGKPAKPGDPINVKDGIGQHDRMFTTPDTNPTSPATDMMANLGSIEFGGKEDKDGTI